MFCWSRRPEGILYYDEHFLQSYQIDKKYSCGCWPDLNENLQSFRQWALEQVVNCLSNHLLILFTIPTEIWNECGFPVLFLGLKHSFITITGLADCLKQLRLLAPVHPYPTTWVHSRYTHSPTLVRAIQSFCVSLLASYCNNPLIGSLILSNHILSLFSWKVEMLR